jgi:hypothetical protein
LLVAYWTSDSIDSNCSRIGEYIDKLLQNFNPSEVLIQKTIKSRSVRHLVKTFIVFYLEGGFKVMLLKHLQSISNGFVKRFGIEELREGVIASGQYLYLSETQHNKVYNTFSVLQKMHMCGWIDLRYAISNCIVITQNYFTGCYR